MKGSTTSSGKRGGMFKDSAHSSQADIVDKWGHDGYDSILHEEELEKSSSSKKSQDFSNQ